MKNRENRKPEKANLKNPYKDNGKRKAKWK
jgi:hypothetical protein